MPWRNPFARTRPTASSTPDEHPDRVQYALTAAAQALKVSQSTITPQYSTWQEEAWGYYDDLGEFRYAVDWKAEMISRCRLRAARIEPGMDEPTFEDSGPAAELVAELNGSAGNQTEMLSTFATQLGVVGDSYLIGETIKGVDHWRVYSADEIKKQAGKYQVIDENSSEGKMDWRDLASSALIGRVWRPHKRMRHIADSPARSMRSTMRELELVNRKIQAQYLSRLATAGVFLIPDEISFPVREEFADEPDPFMAEWIETARAAIRTPGTAAAAVPTPMRVPQAMIKDGFRHIDFTIAADDKIIEKRESAIRRLAMQADVPAEILLGTSGMNHWGAWQIEESAIKTHIASDIELIVNGLTTAYLHPRMEAAGQDPENWVVWYDASELAFRPDKSQNAIVVYDRLELSGEALRRETGFDESDKPTDDEVKEIVLKKLATDPTNAMAALALLLDDPELLGDEPADDNAESDDAPVQEDAEDAPTDAPDGQRQPPDTQDAPADDSRTAAAELDKLLTQASAQHLISVGLNGWTMFHPTVCSGQPNLCPVAQASRHLIVTPGTIGEYECWLSATGRLVVGKQTFSGTTGFVRGHTRPGKGMTNGARIRTNT